MDDARSRRPRDRAERVHSRVCQIRGAAPGAFIARRVFNPRGFPTSATLDRPDFLTRSPTFRLNNAVTTFSRGAEALKTLRDRKEDFDIVLSDVHMPDMDGFKLLEHIALELDIPVMSESSQPPPCTPQPPH